MADSDGKVRIIIDTNAEAAAKSLDDVGNAFKKNADTIQKSSTAYNGYEKAVRDNIQVLRELALGGNQNTEGFKKLAAQTREYQNALRQANEEVNKVTGGIESQNNPISGLTTKLKGLAAAYIGVRGAQLALTKALEATEAYRTQEMAIAQLNTTLANAGVYSAKYSQQIQALASEIQSYSNYGDEVVIKAQALGQSFIGQTRITQQLTKAVVDFAAATGMDLEQAFSLVGKSIGSNTNALARYGVELQKGMSDSQKMEAITKQLASRYTGSAASMANASVQLKNALGDLKEEIGRGLDPVVKQIQKSLAGATASLTNFLKTARNNKISEDIKTYNELIKVESKQLENASGRERERLERSIAKSKAALESLQKEQTGGKYANKTPIKIKDEFPALADTTSKGTKGVSSGTSSQAKQIKDSYDLATEAVEKTRRAVQNAALTYGTTSTQVQTAFEQYKQANQKLNEVNDLFKIEQQKGAYEQLQERVSSLTQTLKDLAAEQKINTDEWNINKTALTQAQSELDKINASLQDNGVKIEDVSRSISSTLSSGIISTLKNGGNAFDVFSNLAVSALQKVLDKIIEMAIIKPLLSNISGGMGGGIIGGIASFFGFKNGAAFKNGKVLPFARGGVVNKPTLFPMANGGTGLMGEAGAEAVMPLTRKNGKLGVEASGSGTVVNIYNQSGGEVETRKRDDGGMDIFIKKVNSALMNQRTSRGFQEAYSRESSKGVQAC